MLNIKTVDTSISNAHMNDAKCGDQSIWDFWYVSLMVAVVSMMCVYINKLKNEIIIIMIERRQTCGIIISCSVATGLVEALALRVLLSVVLEASLEQPVDLVAQNLVVVEGWAQEASLASALLVSVLMAPSSLVQAAELAEALALSLQVLLRLPLSAVLGASLV